MSKKEADYECPTTDRTFPDNPGGQGGPGRLGTLPLGINDFESPGEPQPYAFLIQRPLTPPSDSSHAPFGFVVIHLRAFDAQGNLVPQAIIGSEDWDSAWTWEVRETDREIRLACMGRWYAQAACNNGLTMFRVTNAEGQTFNQQLPLGKQSLFGEFMMQGFRVDTIKAIAINWASTYPGPLGLGNFEEFDLVGAQNPATGLDRLHLDVHCNGGVHISEFYYPKIKLRVSTQDS